MWLEKRKGKQINKENKERKEEGRWTEQTKSEWREKERKRKQKIFRFSLRSTEIGLWVLVGAKGKAGPRNESYAWVPKSWSFIKLHEGGNFPTSIIFSLKVI